ncbi:MAG TPA: A/G-specific adenine glycosylase [Coxiellaceae bacterium]|nr:A/G-specific adenine glycosylase [Coxiellaceae bacterium]
MSLVTKKEANTFRKRVLAWFKHSGRHDLPWQKNANPYRVWISEIMLQQTQVSTVIPYFLRFMQSFPTVTALAKADLNEVLDHWSGLGYYARARNLYKTAHIIHSQYHDKFPRSVDELSALPGIGRSTAGAILSLGHKLPAPILDGNVKRVLARFQAIKGWVGSQATLQKLWEFSSLYTPEEDCGDYNQAMMDLGATLCTRTKPQCPLCPLNKDCKAHLTHQETKFPEGKKAQTKPKKSIIWLLMRDHKEALFLEQRPPAGIWGGLWSPPECPASENPIDWCQQKFGCTILESEFQPKIKHVFSHFELEIQPVLLDVKAQRQVADSIARVWLKSNEKPPGGLAAPVKKLLTQLGY